MIIIWFEFYNTKHERHNANKQFAIKDCLGVIRQYDLRIPILFFRNIFCKYCSKYKFKIKNITSKFMYNIDFKVSGMLLSIPLCINDTISTLTARMQELQLFRDIPNAKIEQKLLKCLKNVAKTNKIHDKIRGKIKQLINKFQQVENKVFIGNQSMNKQTSNNNTFVNMLQQNTINNSYLTNSNSAGPIKIRKYLQNQNLSHHLSQNEEQVMENKLIYKYTTLQQRTKNQLAKNMSKIKVNDLLYQGQRKNLKSCQRQIFHQQRLQNRSPNKKLQNYQTSINVSHKYGDSFMKAENKTMARVDKLLQDVSREVYNPTHSSSALKLAYNPVPKLNQLIEKSRSLSQIVSMQSNQNHHNKYNNFEKKLKQRRNQNFNNKDNIGYKMSNQSSDNKKTAGRIHHRQNLKVIQMNNGGSLKHKNLQQNRHYSQSYGKHLYSGGIQNTLPHGKQCKSYAGKQAQTDYQLDRKRNYLKQMGKSRQNQNKANNARQSRGKYSYL